MNIDDKVQCDHEGCATQINNHRWGKTKAGSEGWFFQKDGKSWCPDHTPDWVAAWRARKATS